MALTIEGDAAMTVGRARTNSKQPRSRARLGTYASTSARVAAARRRPASKVWQVAPKATAALVFVGSIWLLYVLFNSPRFVVAQARIEGARLIPVSEAQYTARLAGASIFRVNPSQVEGRLTAAYECLDGAALSVRLPNQVTITLQEHDPVLVWQTLDRTWWVDLTGRTLGPALTTDNLVTVRDPQTTLVQPGDYATNVPWQLAYDLATALPTARLFDHDREHGLMLHVTEQQWPVYLGRRGDAHLKVAVMQNLVAKLVAERAAVAFIDLRDERWPVYKTR
jgi:cell division septal protein FtsQ